MTTQENVDDVNAWDCHLCKKTFGSELSLKHHELSPGLHQNLEAPEASTPAAEASPAAAEARMTPQENVGDGNAWDCHLCKKTFGSERSLKHHERSPGLHQKNLEAAQASSGAVEAWPAAEATPAKQEVEEMAYCYLCGKSFASERCLKQHEQSPGLHQKNVEAAKQAAEQMTTQDVGDGNAWDCHLCKKTFGTEHSLKHHERSPGLHQKNLAAAQASGAVEASPAAEATPAKQEVEEMTPQENAGDGNAWDCHLCKKTFGSELALKHHERSPGLHQKNLEAAQASSGAMEASPAAAEATPAMPPQKNVDDGNAWDCHLCKKTFGSERSLKHHERSPGLHQKNLEAAQASGAVEAWPAAEATPAKQEVEEMTTQGPVGDVNAWYCPVCGKRFASKRSLKHHEKKPGLHHKHVEATNQAAAEQMIPQGPVGDVNAWCCSVCGKSFGSKRSLKHHQKTPGLHHKHVEAANQAAAEKMVTFDCSLCGKAFALEGALEQHEESPGLHQKNVEAAKQKAAAKGMRFLTRMEAQQRLTGNVHISQGMRVRVLAGVEVQRELTGNVDISQEQLCEPRCKLCKRLFPSTGALRQHERALPTLGCPLPRGPPADPPLSDAPPLLSSPPLPPTWLPPGSGDDLARQVEEEKQAEAQRQAEEQKAEAQRQAEEQKAEAQRQAEVVEKEEYETIPHVVARLAALERQSAQQAQELNMLRSVVLPLYALPLPPFTDHNIQEWCAAGKPSAEELKGVEAVVTNIEHAVRRACARSYSMAIEHIVQGGSTRKRTAVKGRFDLDMVVFLTPFDPALMNEYKSHFKQRLLAPCPSHYHELTGLVWGKDMSAGLCFTVAGIGVDMLFTGQYEGKEAITYTNPRTRFFMASLVQKQVAYVCQRARPVELDVIVGIKKWMKSRDWPVRAPSSYLLEVLVLHEQRDHENNRRALMHRVLCLLAGLDKQGIAFGHEATGLSKPFVLDPVNAANNLLDRLNTPLIAWIAKRAIQLHDGY